MSDEGDKLGRYTLVRRIGKGGMGEVWLAKSQGAHGFEKSVALKRILPQFSSNPHVVNMLVDEARISVLLNHPNVVQVLELGDDNGEYFIAMEYVEGHALSRLLRRLKKSGRRLDVLDSAYITVQVLEGLHAAHVQKDQRGKPAGIIHRDVSPQNVLLSVDGQVKVIDFGIARARERLEVTQGATVKGKLRYMSPEQLSPKLIKGKAIDHRVDVFSAGIVLFEMLANRQRFPGDVEMEIMDAIVKEDTPDLAKEGLIDRELMDILDTALEKDRERRFKDASTFAAHLRSYLYKRDPSYTAERVAKKIRDAFKDDDKKEETESDRSAEPSKGQRMREQRVREVSSNLALHGADKSNDDTEATRTAFRPPVRAVEREKLREVEPEPRTMNTQLKKKKQQSSASAIAAGLALGAALLAVGFLVVKPRLDRHPTPSANPAPTTSPNIPPNAGPVIVAAASGDAVDVLIEAEPATTRISFADQPDPKYVSPARLKLKRGAEVELVFEADGYESERHKLVVSGDAPALKVQLHALPVDLILHVYPRDANITVNGAPARVGMKVIPGQDVEVKAEHAFAKAPRIVHIVPVAGQQAIVDIKLEEVEQAVKSHIAHGTIQINSTPPGADIYVDGQKIRGQTPHSETLAPGPHDVVVELQGKGLKTFKPIVTDGAVMKIDAKLE